MISEATSSLRVAMRAALWAQIIRFCREIRRQDNDATAVPQETLEHARRLLAELPEEVELPRTTVSSEGEIIFTWFKGSDRLDAILAPEGHLTWVFRIGNSIKDGNDIAMSETGALNRPHTSVFQFYG